MAPEALPPACWRRPLGQLLWRVPADYCGSNESLCSSLAASLALMAVLTCFGQLVWLPAGPLVWICLLRCLPRCAPRLQHPHHQTAGLCQCCAWLVLLACFGSAVAGAMGWRRAALQEWCGGQWRRGQCAAGDLAHGSCTGACAAAPGSVWPSSQGCGAMPEPRAKRSVSLLLLLLRQHRKQRKGKASACLVVTCECCERTLTDT